VIGERIYPYTRTTQRQMFMDKRYQKYHYCKQDIAWQVTQIMRTMGWTMLPKSTPLRMALIINTQRGLHKVDRSNQEKAVEDAVQRITFQNDAWIDQTLFHRALTPDRPDQALLVLEVYDPAKSLPEWAAEIWAMAEHRGFKL